MNLPKRRKRPKMGVQKPPRRVFPVHRANVRRHGCCVPNCPYHGMVIDFCHVKTRGAGADDRFGVSLCRFHHSEQHDMGPDRFGEKYGIDLWALAAEFTRKTTDKALREHLKLVSAEELKVWNFEPIRTKAELDTLDHAAIVEGYASTERGDPEPGPNRGKAFWHGWRCAMMDMGEIEIDAAHRQLVHEIAPGGVLRDRSLTTDGAAGTPGDTSNTNTITQRG